MGHISELGGTTVATISGCVDHAGLGAFDGHVSAACGTDTDRLVVDMRDVEFLCAGGLAALSESAKAVLDQGGSFVVCGSRAVLRPMCRTGLSAWIPVFDWLPAALDSVAEVDGEP